MQISLAIVGDPPFQRHHLQLEVYVKRSLAETGPDTRLCEPVAFDQILKPAPWCPGRSLGRVSKRQ